MVLKFISSARFFLIKKSYMILIVFNNSESNLQILQNVKKKLLVMTLALSRIQVLLFTEEQLKLIFNGGKSQEFLF